MTTTMRATVVATNPPASSNQGNVQLALFHTDGSQLVPIKKQAVQADTVAADLAALKVDFNALLAKLRLAGVIA